MTVERQRVDAQAEAILAKAQERADQRRATNPAAAGTIMHYAKLKAERLLADQTRLKIRPGLPRPRWQSRPHDPPGLPAVSRKLPQHRAGQPVVRRVPEESRGRQPLRCIACALL